MTREEATEEIKRIKQGMQGDFGWNKSGIEALDMAIKALEQEPCDDAISRQAVLDMMQMRMGAKELYIAVYDLPSVTPQQGWIPVIERLPEIRQHVLCQCRGKNYLVLRLNHKGDWECIYPRTTYMQSFVIAWQPLPEPYKESEGRK